MSDDAVGMIMNAAGRQPIPSRAEQLHLSRLIRAGLADGATPRQQRAGTRARQRLVQGNARLAVSIARSMSRRLRPGSAMAMEDLIQEAMIGLNTAALKFDPERGFTFSTYATWWCRQGCQRALELHARTVRLPNSVLTLARRWRYRPEGQSVEAFAEEWELKPEAVLSTLQAVAATEMRSLDAHARHDDGEGSSLLDLIAADAPDPLAGTDEAMAIDALAAALPDELAMVELSVVDGFSTTALGELMDCSRATAVKRLAEARDRLAVVGGDEARELVASASPAALTVEAMVEVLAEPAAEPIPAVEPEEPTLQQRLEQAWRKHQRERRRARRRELVAA